MKFFSFRSNDPHPDLLDRLDLVLDGIQVMRKVIAEAKVEREDLNPLIEGYLQRKEINLALKLLMLINQLLSHKEGEAANNIGKLSREIYETYTGLPLQGTNSLYNAIYQLIIAYQLLVQALSEPGKSERGK